MTPKEWGNKLGLSLEMGGGTWDLWKPCSAHDYWVANFYYGREMMPSKSGIGPTWRAAIENAVDIDR